MGRRGVESVRTAENDALLNVLKRARLSLGVTQRRLSERLGRSNNYIANIERGSRRLDVVEFTRIAIVLGIDPAMLYADYLSALPKSPAPNSP